MDTCAIVIATKTDGPAFQAWVPGGCKGLANVGGTAAVGRLVDQLKACKLVSSVVVVGDGAISEATPNADNHIPAGATEAESVIAGMRAAHDTSRCLIMTADMPLVSATALTDLLTHAPDADIVYPVTSRPDVEAAFPGRAVSYLKTKDGDYTGSSALLIKLETAAKKENVLVGLLGARSDPTALLGLIGPWVGLKIMLSTPSLAEMEGYLSKGLGMGCRVFITHYPEMLFSLDSPDDLAIAERALTP